MLQTCLKDLNYKFAIFFIWWSEHQEERFWPIEPFLKLKTTLCKYETSVKIKIGMTYVYKEYEVEIKMVQEQWPQLKVKFFIGFNVKIVI